MLNNSKLQAFPHSLDFGGEVGALIGHRVLMLGVEVVAICAKPIEGTYAEYVVVSHYNLAVHSFNQESFDVVVAQAFQGRQEHVALLGLSLFAAVIRVELRSWFGKDLVSSRTGVSLRK